MTNTDTSPKTSPETPLLNLDKIEKNPPAKNNHKTDSKILHQKFTEYGANAKEWTRKCVLLLPEINRQRIWEKKGFSSIYEYAAKLAGMNREKVNESLRILRKIADKPALKKIVEIKGINAVKPIVTIASVENQNFWAEKAMQLTKNELETYVRDYKSEMFTDLNFFQVNKLPRKAEKTRNPNEAQDLFSENTTKKADTVPFWASDYKKTTISMSLSPETASRLEKLKGDGDWETLMQEFLGEREEKIESTKPEAQKTTSRHIPAEIKRFVLAKYNSFCAFPGCKKKYAELHHSERFFFENTHDPNTIIPLCQTHHSLAHKGLIKNENAPPSNWKIELTPNLDFVDKMFLAHKK